MEEKNISRGGGSPDTAQDSVSETAKEAGQAEKAGPKSKKKEPQILNISPIQQADPSKEDALIGKKKKLPTPLSMNLFFAIIIFAEILIIVGSSSGIMEIVRSTVDGQNRFPDLIWLSLVCIAAGIATVIFLFRFFSAPIRTLGKAVNKVAEGDFSVRLATDKGFSEMRRINANFNKMVEELGATEILQTDFVSNVSHEFKTPITAIEGYATLLDGSEGTTAEQAEYIEKILFNTARLSALVGNILLLSKVDNQSIPDKRASYRLDEQIRKSILANETAWTERECELDVELEEITYFGNEALLYHVWSNLIGNAIKFGPVGGALKISLKRCGSLILFTVADEGDGIDDDAKKHIFDRFYQTDSSHKSEGNGLGLALVKQILKHEGGSVAVTDAVPHGAVFSVTLNCSQHN